MSGNESLSNVPSSGHQKSSYPQRENVFFDELGNTHSTLNEVSAKITSFKQLLCPYDIKKALASIGNSKPCEENSCQVSLYSIEQSYQSELKEKSDLLSWLSSFEQHFSLFSVQKKRVVHFLNVIEPALVHYNNSFSQVDCSSYKDLCEILARTYYYKDQVVGLLFAEASKYSRTQGNDLIGEVYSSWYDFEIDFELLCKCKDLVQKYEQRLVSVEERIGCSENLLQDLSANVEGYDEKLRAINEQMKSACSKIEELEKIVSGLQGDLKKTEFAIDLNPLKKETDHKAQASLPDDEHFQSILSVSSVFGSRSHLASENLEAPGTSTPEFADIEKENTSGLLPSNSITEIFSFDQRKATIQRPEQLLPRKCFGCSKPYSEPTRKKAKLSDEIFQAEGFCKTVEQSKATLTMDSVPKHMTKYSKLYLELSDKNRQMIESVEGLSELILCDAPDYRLIKKALNSHFLIFGREIKSIDPEAANFLESNISSLQWFNYMLYEDPGLSFLRNPADFALMTIAEIVERPVLHPWELKCIQLFLTKYENQHTHKMMLFTTTVFPKFIESISIKGTVSDRLLNSLILAYGNVEGSKKTLNGDLVFRLRTETVEDILKDTSITPRVIRNYSKTNLMFDQDRERFVVGRNEKIDSPSCGC